MILRSHIDRMETIIRDAGDLMSELSMCFDQTDMSMARISQIKMLLSDINGDIDTIKQRFDRG